MPSVSISVAVFLWLETELKKLVMWVVVIPSWASLRRVSEASERDLKSWRNSFSFLRLIATFERSFTAASTSWCVAGGASSTGMSRLSSSGSSLSWVLSVTVFKASTYCFNEILHVVVFDMDFRMVLSWRRPYFPIGSAVSVLGLVFGPGLARWLPFLLIVVGAIWTRERRSDEGDSNN